MKLEAKTVWMLTAVIGLTGGCALGPDYHRLAVETPGQFRFASDSGTNSLADLPWGQVFQDPALQDLIRVALTNNCDLQQAVARVEQARNQAAATRSAFLPQIGYGGDAGRGRNALYNSPASLQGETKTSAFVDLGVAWEMDFWGRLRRLNETARARYLASEQARRGVTLSLVGSVATAYFQLAELDRELAIQRSATNAYATSYRLFNDRKINGVASKLETDRAMAALVTAAVNIPDLEMQIATTENQLNVLLGRNPGPIPRRSLAGLPPSAPEIPAGLPAALLRRRPDVLEAEQMVVAANAGIGSSLADFFPRIGLTTLMGRASPELSSFTATAGNLWSVGGSVTGPLFEGGALRAQYRSSKAQFQEALAAYRQSVLVAFQEVSDALVTREKLGEMGALDHQAIMVLTSAVELATARYLNGKSSYDEVLQAQQQLYPALVALARTQAGERIALVQLYKALGGGWTEDKKTNAER